MFTKLKALEVLMGTLEFFALHIVAKLLYYCLCLFDAIMELHALVENTFNDYHIGR